MDQNNQEPTAELEAHVTCKGVTKKGVCCKNPPMPGYEYCSQHQPTCAYKGPNGETCRNFVTEDNTLCNFHATSDEAEEGAQPTQQTSFIGDRYTRREIITFQWPLKAIKKVASSVTSLPRPIQIAGGIIVGGVADYLISDFLDYFKETHNIEFLFPLSFGDRPQVEGVRAPDINERTTIPRTINKGTSKATVQVDFVDYQTGQTYSSPAATISPGYSSVGWIADAHVPDGFFGGATVSSDQPVEAIQIVKLKMASSMLNPYESQFLHWIIPISQTTPLEVRNVSLMMAVGREEKLQSISDIPCVSREDRIYFDRESILDLIETTGATEGMLVVQLEGQFIISQHIHDLAKKHLAGYEVSKAETRFETTAEVVAVVI